MDVVSCGIHGFSEAIGIDADELRLFWKLESAIENAKQSAYRVVVSTRDAGRGDCYDSGRVEGSEQRNILCKPDKGFQPTSFHYWTVQVWDQDGNDTISAVNEFYTSYPRSNRLLPPYSMNQIYVSSCNSFPPKRCVIF